MRYVPIVALGGAAGTLARYFLSAAIPGIGAFPVNVIVINLSGAFLLGWLLEALTMSGPDSGLRKTARLGFGTGVLGGYTTYSMFVVDENGLIDSGNFVASLVFAFPTVVAGVICALLGSRLARLVADAVQKRRQK